MLVVGSMRRNFEKHYLMVSPNISCCEADVDCGVVVVYAYSIIDAMNKTLNSDEFSEWVKLCCINDIDPVEELVVEEFGKCVHGKCVCGCVNCESYMLSLKQDADVI